MQDRYSVTGRPPFDAKSHCPVCLGMSFHPVPPFGAQMHVVPCEKCDATGRIDKVGEKITEERMIADMQKIAAAIKGGGDYLAADQERAILMVGRKSCTP